MTYGEKMDILMKYRRTDKRIGRLMEEKAAWMERAISVNQVYRQAPGIGSGGPGKILSAVEKMDEIEREITEEIDKLADLRKIVSLGIRRVRDDKLQDILGYRYLLGMTWAQVADKMEMDERWVRRLHVRAVTQLTLESPP